MTITLATTATPIQLNTTLATTAYSGSQIRDLGQMLGRDRVAKTGAYTVLAADRGKTVDCTSGTFTVSLTAAATVGNGFHVAIVNSGSGTVTIDADGSETIRGPAGSATTLALAQGQSVILVCDGSGWLAVASAGLTPAPGATMSIADDKFTITGSASATKSIRFEADTQTGAYQLTIDAGAQTGTRRLSAPVLAADDTLMVLGLAQTRTAGLTVQAAAGITALQAATQDAVALVGRAGGTGSYVATITPGTLTASRTYTLPDATGTIGLLSLAQTWSALQTYGAGLTVSSGTTAVQALTATSITNAALTSGRVPFASTAGLMTDSANLTFSGTVLTSNNLMAVAPTTSAMASFQMTNATPGFGWDETDAGADAKVWDMFASSGSLLLRCGNDARSTFNTFWTLSRSGATPSAMTLGSAVNFTLSGNISQTGATTLSTGTGTITLNGAVTIASTVASGLTIAATSGTTLTVSSTQASTSTSTGAIVCSGGVGVAGRVTAATLAATGLTSGRIPYLSTGGLFVDNAAFALTVSTTATLSVGNTTNGGNVTVNAAAAGQPGFFFQTAGVNKWLFRLDAVAESGSDAGANFTLVARNDAGGNIDTALTVVRASGGAITIGSGRPLRLGNTYVAGAPGAATGTVTIQDAAGNTYRIPVLV